MKNKILLIFGLGMLILPMINADILMPGYHGIDINNEITNINDFPNYVFISGPGSESGPGLGMCPLKIIGSEGNIESYYKFCGVSVYAISKEDFNIEKINEINKEENYSIQVEKFNSINKREVIKNIETYTTVPDSSTQNEINNYYEIDVNKLILEPSNKKITRNNLIYVYIIIPIIALIIIIFLIFRRRK